MSKNDEFQLILPCAPNEFGSFIAGLLGKPRETKGRVSGAFDITSKDISNFYHLINQRITQQNRGNLVHLSITVIYDNGTAVTHNNPNDFESHYPISATIPLEVILSFTYLIHFNGSLQPEKQEIDIVLSTNRDRGASHWTHSGVCHYSVKHTDSSWAADIANIIKSHAETLIDVPGPVRQRVNESFETIFRLGVSLIYVAVAIWWGFTAFDAIHAAETFNDALAFVTSSIATLITVGVIYSLSYEYIIHFLMLSKSSFICLVDKDFTSKDKTRIKEGRRWISYAATWAINIICGVVASYLFTKF
ncbi:hypothetical protein [Stutzerimonas nitrititolerans]|uniref:hypothetical protein n=1 Tax=Stutzerimonas nitrititolerans TaxID=2482751 RepID=UPI001BD43751|nr:hypothetical protein [Stutzerimonas nitrititolerans]